MTDKQRGFVVVMVLAITAGIFVVGYSTGTYRGHSKGFKEGLVTVCSTESVKPPQPAQVVEADASLNQNLHFKLGRVAFDTQGYCTVSLFSIAENKLGQGLANLGIKVPKKDCLTLPQRIGSQYRMVLSAETPIAEAPTP